MPTVRLPSQPKVYITINSDHVTHTVMDERNSQARLSVNLMGGFTLEGRVSDNVTLDDLRTAHDSIVRLINTPAAR